MESSITMLDVIVLCLFVFHFVKSSLLFPAGTPLSTKQSKALSLAIEETRKSFARKKDQSFSLCKEV